MRRLCSVVVVLTLSLAPGAATVGSPEEQRYFDQGAIR